MFVSSGSAGGGAGSGAADHRRLLLLRRRRGALVSLAGICQFACSLARRQILQCQVAVLTSVGL